MVGRPREFDIDQVLNQAMEVFWQKGYEATSMSDLMSATGLHKGSIYQTFGSKHELFLAALNRYLKQMHDYKHELLTSAATPLDGIRAVAHGMIDITDCESHPPKGCMVINAVVELAPHDPEVKRTLDAHMANMRASLIDVVQQAQEANQIDQSKSPEVVAMLIAIFVSGLGSTLKGPLSKEEAHQLMDEQLAAVI